MRIAVGIAFGLACLAAMPGAYAQPAGNARTYFGHIEAPCQGYSETKGPDGKVLQVSPSECAQLLADMAALDQCTEIEKPCAPATRLMKAVFRHTYHETFPDFIFYLEQKEPGKFKKHFPVLIWRGQNTPYLFGVRDVFAVVFSEQPACIDVHVTAEYKSEPNPFSALFTVLGKNPEPKPGATGPTDQRIAFHWYPLSGDAKAGGPWFAVARARAETNSTNRITVLYNQPKAPKPAADKPADKPAAASPSVDDKPAFDPCVVSKPADYSGNFLAANGFFSNSPDSQVTVALAIGVTLNAKGTSVASGGSDVNYNGYALVKFYPQAYRPRLRAGAADLGPRASWGVVVGTNIVNSPFDELIVGVSRGHIWGNVGVTVGINSVEGKKDTDQGRKERLFLGLDYSF